MISKLLVAVPLLLQAAAPPDSSLTAAPPPIKMGLWEASITTAMGTSLKTRACLTPQSYRDQLAHIPEGCILSNQRRSNTSMSADVSCTLSNGVTSSGHFDAQFPDPSTVRSTISITTSMQGHSIPTTITTESHFVGADCGELQPGQSKIIR